MEFTHDDVEVAHAAGSTTLHVRGGGSGPPVLLLHGFPQTGALWVPVAEQLAAAHTVVVPDLRGYGASARPASGPDHAEYSFRTMAADLAQLMTRLRFGRFSVAGHDRGGRVAHRLALDHSERIDRIAVLDILPTTHVYDTLDKRVAEAYYHWFLLTRPAPLPERLVDSDPLGFLHSLLGSAGSAGTVFDPAALREYERAFQDPAARHAMFEDYRAASGIDLEHDRADLSAGRRVRAPLLAVWARRGIVAEADPLKVWGRYAESVEGAEIDAGHFLVDERPGEVTEHLARFLGASR